MKSDSKLEQGTETLRSIPASLYWPQADFKTLIIGLIFWMKGDVCMEKLKIKSKPRPVLFACDKLAHKTVNVSQAQICQLNIKSSQLQYTIPPLVLTRGQSWFGLSKSGTTTQQFKIMFKITTLNTIFV